MVQSSIHDWREKRMKIAELIAEDWNKVNHHDKTNGLSQKAVNAYRREHPGSKLKTAVTTKPSKLKKGSKAANRRKSFCARMGGNKGPMKKPNGEPTPKALALRRWHCESIEEMADMIARGEQMIAEMTQQQIAEGGAQQAAIAIAKKKSGKYDKDGKRIKESATAVVGVGSISGGSVGHQLQRRAFNKSYTGSMTSGTGKKSPKQPAAKKQKPSTNALDGNNLVV